MPLIFICLSYLYASHILYMPLIYVPLIFVCLSYFIYATHIYICFSYSYLHVPLRCLSYVYASQINLLSYFIYATYVPLICVCLSYFIYAIHIYICFSYSYLGLSIILTCQGPWPFFRFKSTQTKPHQIFRTQQKTVPNF